MNSLERDIAGAAAAHRRLEADVAALTDEQARSQSNLPGWTVGHVLTHLARNADSFTRMLQAAMHGEVAEQYPGGRDRRAADIEAGSGRRVAALRDDAVRAAAELEATWAQMTADAWEGHGDTVAGRVRCDDLPSRRWRETAVHHADLGLAYGWSDWPDDFVRLELGRMTMLWNSRSPMGLTGLPSEALAVPDRHRLAWLLGRADIDGLEPAGLM